MRLQMVTQDCVRSHTVSTMQHKISKNSRNRMATARQSNSGSTEFTNQSTNDSLNSDSRRRTDQNRLKFIVCRLQTNLRAFVVKLFDRRFALVNQGDDGFATMKSPSEICSSRMDSPRTFKANRFGEYMSAGTSNFSGCKTASIGEPAWITPSNGISNF